MRKVIFSTLLVLLLGLLAFAYQDLLQGNDFIAKLSYTNKISYNTIWKITAYCPGSCCNTRYTNEGIENFTDCAAVGGLTLSGLLKERINVVAVDPAIIPLGSIIKYNNTYYVALDTGSAIKGYTLDILFPEHKQAHHFGVKYSKDVEIFITDNPKKVIETIRAKTRIRKP